MMPAPGDQHQPLPNPFQQPASAAAFGVSNGMQNGMAAQQQPAAAAQRVSEYTAQEIATLQSRLERQLGPEYLSARSGPSGQKVHYIAAEKVIGLANEVFGFNGWSSSIQNIQIDFVDEHPHTFKISVGLSVIVRVTLRDGTFHEDIGYGHIENCKGKAAAFEKAKKEGTTDALKRALRNFGNVLGNCIYDKSYVDRVSKMKVVPVNRRALGEHGLHRHADYAVKTEDSHDHASGARGPAGASSTVLTTTAATAATANVSGPVAARPVPQAQAAPPAAARTVKPEMHTFSDVSDMFDDDLLGDFDEADFCVSDEGHPDEVMVREASVPVLPLPQQNQGSRDTSPVRQILPQQQPQQQQNSTSRPSFNGAAPRPPQTPTPLNGRQIAGGNGPRPYQPGTTSYAQANRGQQPQAIQVQGGQRPQAQQNGGGGAISASQGEGTPWLSARAVAKAGDGDALGVVAPSVQAGHLFNPKAESPSIRKTPGFDHNTSKPIPRQGRATAGSSVAAAAAMTAATAAATTTSGGTAASAGGAAAGVGTPRGVAQGLGRPLPEPTRRIGAPPSASSPLANRGQFKPPPMKRGLPSDAPAGSGPAARTPLADMPSNVSTAGSGGGVGVVAVGAGAVGAGTGGSDVKRQKMA